ncbi:MULTISPECIES: AraC family transcriptional regulator [unclassified Oceanispirochaeta]|uniref:helix-turn-helix domain-containing protein n=1 Tax=unclassified Oceanispirochaeta TaxID=2635722 RepID=UPI000E096DB4|nr:MULTISPECIES: helix-turn-helix transcriptional regulator [unclassified Oceanispirochaeta]MBF9018923.1 helix-turn-helix transcriptional regulator [Oceanispirochaeta sp. M2]NPD75422.1 helix-turn-helix transcriptional regulator [Oceanispirochaeta sp. M1]RDG28722.1 AraC family transcriptional regulator [Oceanispirochaeta sp. M1]
MGDLGVINIDFAHYYECPPEWYWIPENNNWSGLHLWLVIKGRGEVQKENISYGLEPGVCMLFRMQDNYMVTQNPLYPLSVYGINISVNERIDELPEYVFLEDYALLKSLMRRLVDLHNMGDTFSEESMIMIRAALCEFKLSAHKNFGLPDYSDARLNNFVYQVRKNPGSKYTIQEVAEALHCSPNQCIRRIRKYTGFTPIQLVNRIKIDKAKQHLMATSYSISEIAEMLGFCDMYYFSKVFKQVTGVSPSTYRS